MPNPDFTPQEKYVISYLKSPAAIRSSASFMWGYVIGSILLAGCGVYFDSVFVLIVAFIVLIGFRIYEEQYQKGWLPVWCSIVRKYETALEASVDSREPKS
jgi:hypothetical protein